MTPFFLPRHCVARGRGCQERYRLLARKIGSTPEKAPLHGVCAHHEHDGPPVRARPPARRLFELLDESGRLLGAHGLRRLHRALATHPRDDAVDEIREAHGLLHIARPSAT